MEGLPLLPGYSIFDSTRTKHNVPHLFDWKNGYPQITKAQSGIGDTPLDVNSILYLRGLDSVRYDPSLTYGRTKTYLPQPAKPHFVLYDKKCLAFKGFFKQGIPNSPDEYFRVRLINFVYFLEDDTITIMEPSIENAGFPQGRLVTRNKIQKEDRTYYHWKDLNVGINIKIYGIVYHLCSCDGYTREYLMSQGVEVNENEELPIDPYARRREAQKTLHTTVTPTCEDALYKYLAFDRKILRFYAVWDDRDSEHGGLKNYKIHYFLSEDKMEIIAQTPGHIKEPYPILIAKSKIPKNWTKVSDDFPSIYLEKLEEDYQEYYTPRDLIVGNTMFIFGRRFLLCDCDLFTRTFYKNIYHIEQPPAINLTEKKTKSEPDYPVPPYTGYGTVEDSLESYKSFMPKAPRKDLIRYLMNMSKKLRYNAIIECVRPEDENRQFILEYRLSDGCIMIHELRLQNTGFEGGRFLTYTLVPKPDTSYNNPEYYTPRDFTLGAIINCFGHKFRITGVDLGVYRYMEANPEKFTPEAIYDIRKYLVREGYLNEDIRDVSDYRRREEISEPQMEDVGEIKQTTVKEILSKTEPPKCVPLVEQEKFKLK